jgi:multiple sugar transport system substrate-binding protein
MRTLDRRSLLRGAASSGLALGMAYALGACGEPSSSGSGPKAAGVDWWDASEISAALNEKVVEEMKAELGTISVEITYLSNAKIGQSLQLAKQSNQLPDITSNLGLGVPLPKLIEDGWFQPLDLPGDAAAKLDSMNLLEGIHVFDGKPYTFPGWAADTNMVNWYHVDVVEKAGLDPASPPTTYDEMRDALRQGVGATDTAGLLLAMVQAGRNAGMANWLAQAAGFEGNLGQLFRTGEYVFEADEYVNAIEFLYSLKRDKLLAPGELNLDVKAGQGRWAGGTSAYFFDGPWMAGNIALSYPQLEGKVGAGKLLVPDSSHQIQTYAPPITGQYFITKDADPEPANKVLALTLSDDYQQRFAEAMGHPPIEPNVIKKADVFDVWRESCLSMAETLYLAPDPSVANTDVAAVQAELKPVTPDLGTIIQGYFSGDVPDVKAALKTLSGASAKELSRAIDAAKGKGAKVSMDDYAFPDWQPRTHFTTDMYG